MTLRIGSWPGDAFSHNPFMRIFLQSLRDAGAEVVSLESVDALIAADVDAVVLHWAETVLWESRDRWMLMAKIARLSRFLARPRGRRPKLVWLAHNLAPHNTGFLQRRIWPFYLRQLTRGVDGVLTLAPGTVEVVRRSFPALAGKPMGHIWHPAYPAPAIGAAEARAAEGFGPGLQVLGYCGQLRPYKGVDLALEAFLPTTDPALRLYLAGKLMDAGLGRAIAEAEARDSRVIARIGDLPGPDFEAALMRCDTIVSPLRNYLHSGSLVHAVSAGRQVLTPSSPFADSLAQAVPGGWVQPYEGPLTPARLEALAGQRPATPAPDLSALDPLANARACLDFIAAL